MTLLKGVIFSNHQILTQIPVRQLHTSPLFSESKLLKVKGISSLTKLLFMFDFINENVPDELKTIFVINRSIHSYETRSSMVFHIPKAKTSRFGLNTLRYDGANLWNKFYHSLLYKEPNLRKTKKNQNLKKYFKCISWILVLNKFSSHFRLFCFFFNSTAAKI